MNVVLELFEKEITVGKGKKKKKKPEAFLHIPPELHE